MESSSSFYIPPRPHPTPLQRRRAVRSNEQESDCEAELGSNPVKGDHHSAQQTSQPGRLRPVKPQVADHTTQSPLDQFAPIIRPCTTAPILESRRSSGPKLRTESMEQTMYARGKDIVRATTAAPGEASGSRLGVGPKLTAVTPPTRPVTCSPTLQKKERRQASTRTYRVEDDENEPTSPVPRKVSRSKSTKQRESEKPDDLHDSQPRHVSRSTSKSKCRDHHRESEASVSETPAHGRVSRSKTQGSPAKPHIRRTKTEPVEPTAPVSPIMPRLRQIASAQLPSHPHLPSHVDQHRRSPLRSDSTHQPTSRVVSHSHLSKVINHPENTSGDGMSAASSEAEDGGPTYFDRPIEESPESMTTDEISTPYLGYLRDSPEISKRASTPSEARGRGPRQPAHPMLSREKPEQVPILKGSHSAYPLLHSKSTKGVLELPPGFKEFEPTGRRSRSSTPEPVRPLSRFNNRLRPSPSQTLPDGYTFPTDIADRIPRGPMRPLCAVPTAGYTAEPITPLLNADDTDEEARLPSPTFPRDVRNIASPASGTSMNPSSDSHGVVMINGRPFSPDSRPFSPDMITSESSMPATPEASDMGHGHMLQVYVDEGTQPTLEQLIAEQMPLALRPVELENAGSAYVVDLSKAARKAARRAEKEAEKEAKREAKAVRRATKRESKRRGSTPAPETADIEPVSGVDVADDHAVTEAAVEAAKLEAERLAAEIQQLEEAKLAKEQERRERAARRAAREAEARARDNAYAEAEAAASVEDDARRLAREAEERERMDRERAAVEAVEKEKRRRVFHAERLESERAERAAFEKKRAEEKRLKEAEAAKERAEREAAAVREKQAREEAAWRAQVEAAELAAVAEAEDAKARARLERKKTARTSRTELGIAPERTRHSAPTPLQEPPPVLSPKKTSRKLKLKSRSTDSYLLHQVNDTERKTPAQLEKEAYEASRLRAEMEAQIQETIAVQQERDAERRVSDTLNRMSIDLARARKARRDSKILDYGYPSAEYDPPHRTEGMGLKLVTSPTSPSALKGKTAKSTKYKSASKVVSLVAAVVPALSPKVDAGNYARGFRSISYADLQEAAEDKRVESEIRDWEAEMQMKTLREERRRSEDFKEWSRKTKSREAGRRISQGSVEISAALPGESRRPVTDLRATMGGPVYGHCDRDEEDEEEWETEEGSDQGHGHAHSPTKHHDDSDDQWEDMSSSSSPILSDQEVHFRTSDLDSNTPHRRKSHHHSPAAPVRPPMMKRASTVRLIKLERHESIRHDLDSPSAPVAPAMKSRVSSAVSSVGSAPWCW